MILVKTEARTGPRASMAPPCLFGGRWNVLIRPPRADGDGNPHHKDCQRHPVLDMNAEDAESLDEDMQGRSPLWNRMARTSENI
jgi:hypothetical protein